MDAIFFIGRLLFIAIFLGSALGGHLGPGRAQTVEYARASGAPAPETTVPLSGIVMLVGSAMIGLGVWADVGALLLIAFLIPTTFIMHAYWKVEDPQMKQMQIINFNKNISLIGAALIIFWAFNQLQGAAPVTLTDPLFGAG